MVPGGGQAGPWGAGRSKVTVYGNGRGGPSPESPPLILETSKVGGYPASSTSLTTAAPGALFRVLPVP